MLDVVREIGERMGRVIAVQVLGSGAECRDTPWVGLYPLDADLYDELAAVNVRPPWSSVAGAPPLAWDSARRASLFIVRLCLAKARCSRAS